MDGRIQFLTRRFGRVCLAALAAVFVAWTGSCSKNADDPGQAGQPVNVRFGYFANLTHAQAVLGVASGDFERALAPDQFSSRVFNAGPSLIEALFANELDIGFVGPGPALNAFEKSRGEGLRVLAGAAANGVVIVARSGSGIKTMADLAGKKVATPQTGNTQDLAARHYLTSVLRQPNADNVLAIANAEQASMMLRGEIDASWAPEPWGARLIAEVGAELIAEEKDLWPSREFANTVIVVRPQFLHEHPDIVDRLLRVHLKWSAALQQNPELHLGPLGAALQSLTGKKLPADVVKSAFSRIVFTDDPGSQTFQTMSQWALDLGFSKSSPDFGKLIDTRALDQARRSPETSPAGGGAKP